MSDLLYIDTNAYLNLYQNAHNDLSRIADELVQFIDNGDISLILPSQTKSEFLRNRDSVVYKALGDINSPKKLNKQFPLPKLAKEFKEDLESVSNKYEEFFKEFSNFEDAVKQKAHDDDLHADHAVKKMHKKAVEFDSDTVYDDALARFYKGHPPRKDKDSNVGDNLIWCSLLKQSSTGNLHIVTADKDFITSMGNIHKILIEEWKVKCGESSKIFIYKDMKSFMAEHFETTEFVSWQVNKLVADLCHSPNFDTTDRLISKLYKLKDNIKDEHKERLFEALVSNDQIYWIIDKGFIQKFFKECVISENQTFTDKGKSDLVKYGDLKKFFDGL